MPVLPVVFVPKSHPERPLVAAMAAVVLVCVGLWWSGAVGPRLTAVVGSVEADAATGRGTLHIELRNEGRLPLELRGVTVDDRRGPPVDLGPVLVDGHPADDVWVGVGDLVRLDVAYTVDCHRPTGYGADPELGVSVRAPLGVTQTRPIRRDASVGRSVDPGPLLCPGR